ncbi:MAG: sigma-54-dependent Fis family transcriptional regulator, partial [Candidatus Marinimicrobia bacterium]|nr:sigma-54-dependent Fis family transcriptional regulator [Candidatus Neomarinimicrobiota bacterium]
MMTSSDSVELAVEAMKMGAYDYIRKPVEFERLFTTIGNALNVVKAQKEIAQLKKNLIEKYQFKKIIGESKPMKKLFEEMTSLLDKSTTILIQAESGTGKELVAKAIHYSGKKSKAPFVAVNCAAIPAGLLESELFGHERGAFTGAITRHIGKFEQANGGTIFLDEIGEMPLNAQARLLRVIQEREFERVGGSAKVKVAVRIIAATNQNLSEMVEQKRFREDLYYRLSVFPLLIPPLRERRDDIALLVAHLLYKYQEDDESEPHEISPEA